MDGVGQKKNVFFIGATNRPDILDEALVRPGRLDQLIYIPLPDQGARVSVFKAVLRKTPIAKNISFDFLSTLTDGFSGADITELCQRATKAAIRESIEADEQRKKLAGGDEDMMEGVDPVPVLTRAHFEEAIGAARVSVNQFDLKKFEEFRLAHDPAYKAQKGKQGPKINWPADNSAQFENRKEEEDDIYS
jgi:transitional endoplasmic reticulum ATPase